jgi:hypothetical protein
MRTTWTLALLALAAAVALALTSCGNTPPGPVDAPCDLVSCEAGAAFECCPLAPPPPPAHTRIVSPLVAAIVDGWVPDFGAASGLSRNCLRSTGFGGRFALPIPVDHGERMLALTATINGDDSSEIDIIAAGFVTSVDLINIIGARTILNTPAGWHRYPIDLTDTIAGDEAAHWIEVVADQPGVCVGAFRLTYDRPEEL